MIASLVTLVLAASVPDAGPTALLLAFAVGSFLVLARFFKK